MSVIADNAEHSEQDLQIIGSMFMCPNGHVFEPVTEIVLGIYTINILWCGSCATGHRIQFSIGSEVKRYEDGVSSPEQVSFFLLVVETSVKDKDADFLNFLRQCSKALRNFPPKLPEQDWLAS